MITINRPRRRMAGLVVALVVLGLSAAPVGAASAQAGPLAAAASAPVASVVTVSPAQPLHAYGTSMTVSAKITANGGKAVPTGTALFEVDGQRLVRVLVGTGGSVSAAVPWSLALGAHSVRVTYAPYAASPVAASAGSAAFLVGKAAPAWATSVPQNQPAFGTVTTVRVSVIAPHVVAKGIVVLRDGATNLAAAALTGGGSANLTFRINFDSGRHNLTAYYTGSGPLAASNITVPIVTSRAIPTVRVSAPGSVAYGQRATVNIAVSTSTGPVSVLLDGSTVRSTNLSGGIAGVTLPTLTGGSHRVAAAFGGNARYQPATSPAITVTGASSPCPVTARACVDLTHSLTWMQTNGQVTYGPVAITSGRPGYRTPTGSFQAYWFDKNHHSSEFNNAPMPNSVFFNGGVAFHQGSLFVASHGCIHLSGDASLHYFNNLNVGDQVYVFGYAPY